MKRESKNKKERSKKIHAKKKVQVQEKLDKLRKIDEEKMMKKRKKFALFFLLWICIFSVGLVRKTFQNDTFYTIEIGELILNNGIDMMDHFSIHSSLSYTYPHWLYDVFIYICYMIGGYSAIHISSVVLLVIILGVVFRLNTKITNNYSVSAFATFICALALSGFATARAQLASFLVFAAQIYFIEMFLQNGKKRYLFGLIFLSWLICNIHVAVWPFYFIVFLPYLAEFVLSFIVSKIKLKKHNKFTTFLKNKFVLDKNKNIKWLFVTMLVSSLTGLLTPIGDTPYTYMINMMMSDAQEYVQEHQMITWINSPFTIIIAGETLFLSLISKVKLRDFFMICGLALMSVISVRHIALLALIGTICFARLFSMFFENYKFDIDDKIIKFINKKSVAVTSFVVVIVISSLLLSYQLNEKFVDDEMYPVEAVKYIKENINIDEMRIFNEYNFGSYLLHHDIPVFIDSRADLYTSEFSDFEYDIFDDFRYSPTKYQEVFDFYDITHILIYKDKDNAIYRVINGDDKFNILYEDEFFIFYERLV